MNKDQKNPQPAFCPNCNKPAIRRGMVIDCENCDASFRYTPEGPKLKQIGALDDHEKRLQALEEKAGIRETAEPDEKLKDEEIDVESEEDL